MNRFLRVLAAAVAMLAICAPIAQADEDDPYVDARNATAVTDTSAVLNAYIETNDDDGAWYRFQYGPGNYANQTSLVWLSGDVEQDVSVQVTGLTPNTSYQFRAVAWNDDGSDAGGKRNYSTGNATAAVGATPKGPKAPVTTPELGKSLVAEAATGTVLVKEKGSSEFVPIEQAESIPVDSTIDTTAGTVVLETAVAGGESQTGTFWGGKFQVRQSDSGKGMTTIALRGGDFSACRSGTAKRSVGKLPRRELWSKDKGGKFKTSGKGSVATVRGTAWYTADTCEGTLTKVSHGAVRVRERGTGRSELVRRGESFFGRSPH